MFDISCAWQYVSCVNVLTNKTDYHFDRFNKGIKYPSMQFTRKFYCEKNKIIFYFVLHVLFGINIGTFSPTHINLFSYCILLRWSWTLHLVPGVSHVKKCDWLVKNMTDWRLEVDLKKLNDWLTTCYNMTGGGGVMTTSASTGVVYSAPQAP